MRSVVLWKWGVPVNGCRVPEFKAVGSKTSLGSVALFFSRRRCFT